MDSNGRSFDWLLTIKILFYRLTGLWLLRKTSNYQASLVTVHQRIYIYFLKRMCLSQIIFTLHFPMTLKSFGQKSNSMSPQCHKYKGKRPNCWFTATSVSTVSLDTAFSNYSLTYVLIKEYIIIIISMYFRSWICWKST